MQFREKKRFQTVEIELVLKIVEKRVSYLVVSVNPL